MLYLKVLKYCYNMRLQKIFHMHNNRSKLCKTKQKKGIATFIEASLTNEMYYRQTYSWSKKNVLKLYEKFLKTQIFEIYLYPLFELWLVVIGICNLDIKLIF